MIPLDGLSMLKAFGNMVNVPGKLYQWLVKERLRNRSEEMARSVPTAAVIRGASVKLRWYEFPAARALQREGRGTINYGYYETWVNVTPPGILMAMTMRG